jgi:hypothetical protein
MLVRDISGRIHIVSRKECKHDTHYYQKLVKIKSEYTQYYKSVLETKSTIKEKEKKII